MEKDIIIFLQNNGNQVLDTFFKIVSYVSSWVGALILLAIILIFVNKKFGLFWSACFIITICINYLIKTIVNRPRPFETYIEIENKLGTIGKSFPSGHTLSATFMMLCLLLMLNILYKQNKIKFWGKRLLRILITSLCILFVILCAISRMYLGQHYISDIFGGMIVAVVFFLISYKIYGKFFCKDNKIID